MNDDIQAIKNLIFAYAEAFDLGDFDAAVGLFRDASVQVAGADVELRGEEARLLLTGMVQTYEGIPRTKHLTTNVVVEIEDGGALRGRTSSLFRRSTVSHCSPSFLAAGTTRSRRSTGGGVSTHA